MEFSVHNESPDQLPKTLKSLCLETKHKSDFIKILKYRLPDELKRITLIYQNDDYKRESTGVWSRICNIFQRRFGKLNQVDKIIERYKKRKIASGSTVDVDSEVFAILDCYPFIS